MGIIGLGVQHKCLYTRSVAGDPGLVYFTENGSCFNSDDWSSKLKIQMVKNHSVWCPGQRHMYIFIFFLYIVAAQRCFKWCSIIIRSTGRGSRLSNVYLHTTDRSRHSLRDIINSMQNGFKKYRGDCMGCPPQCSSLLQLVGRPLTNPE